MADLVQLRNICWERLNVILLCLILEVLLELWPEDERELNAWVAWLNQHALAFSCLSVLCSGLFNVTTACYCEQQRFHTLSACNHFSGAFLESGRK